MSLHAASPTPCGLHRGIEAHRDAPLAAHHPHTGVVQLATVTIELVRGLEHGHRLRWRLRKGQTSDQCTGEKKLRVMFHHALPDHGWNRECRRSAASINPASGTVLDRSGADDGGTRR